MLLGRMCGWKEGRNEWGLRREERKHTLDSLLILLGNGSIMISQDVYFSCSRFLFLLDVIFWCINGVARSIHRLSQFIAFKAVPRNAVDGIRYRPTSWTSPPAATQPVPWTRIAAKSVLLSLGLRVFAAWKAQQTNVTRLNHRLCLHLRVSAA